MSNDKSERDALLPCPFCGNEPWGVFGPDVEGKWWVECHGPRGVTLGCGDWFPSTDCLTREDVVAAWNTRASLSPAEPATVVLPVARVTVADVARQSGAVSEVEEIHANLAALRARLKALALSALAESGLTAEQREVLTFLTGVGLLRGCGFGERPKGERGLYWWRSDLRCAFPELPAAPGVLKQEGGSQ